MELLLGGPDKLIGIAFHNIVRYRTHDRPDSGQYEFTTHPTTLQSINLNAIRQLCQEYNKWYEVNEN